MNRFSLIVVCCLVFSGCASSSLKTSNRDASQDLKSKEYEALKQDVSSFHEASLFGPGQPWLFTTDTATTAPQEFARNHCHGGGVFRTTQEADDCSRLFNQATFEILSQKYFAADPTAIGKKCQTDLLVCNDLMALEALFRNLHNAGIEESKNEKLASLEEWRQGRLSDDELKAQLHLEFAMKGGKFIVSLPANSVPADKTVVGAGQSGL